jgi:hypothetical protein
LPKSRCVALRRVCLPSHCSLLSTRASSRCFCFAAGASHVHVCAPASRAPHLSHLTFAFPRCRCPRFYPPPRTRAARVSLNCIISRRKSSVIISLPCALSPRPPLTRTNCWHSVAVPCRNSAATLCQPSTTIVVSHQAPRNHLLTTQLTLLYHAAPNRHAENTVWE